MTVPKFAQIPSCSEEEGEASRGRKPPAERPNKAGQLPSITHPKESRKPQAPSWGSRDEPHGKQRACPAPRTIRHPGINIHRPGERYEISTPTCPQLPPSENSSTRSAASNFQIFPHPHTITREKRPQQQLEFWLVGTLETHPIKSRQKFGLVPLHSGNCSSNSQLLVKLEGEEPVKASVKHEKPCLEVLFPSESHF